MLTKDEIDEIREEIASEPETSPARRLLAEIDRRNEEERVRTRARHMSVLRHDMGYSEAEAEAVLVFIEGGGRLVEEEIRCWACEGTGQVVAEMGCFGPKSWGKCSKCWGKRKATRLAIPKEEPVLPPNPIRTYAGYDRTEP